DGAADAEHAGQHTGDEPDGDGQDELQHDRQGARGYSAPESRLRDAAGGDYALAAWRVISISTVSGSRSSRRSTHPARSTSRPSSGSAASTSPTARPASSRSAPPVKHRRSTRTRS